jgi:hypothetical protein
MFHPTLLDKEPVFTNLPKDMLAPCFMTELLGPASQ